MALAVTNSAYSAGIVSVGANISATFASAPIQGNALIACITSLSISAGVTFNAGWFPLTVAQQTAAAPALYFFAKLAGASEPTTQSPASLSGAGTIVGCVIWQVQGFTVQPNSNASLAQFFPGNIAGGATIRNATTGTAAIASGAVAFGSTLPTNSLLLFGSALAVTSTQTVSGIPSLMTLTHGPNASTIPFAAYSRLTTSAAISPAESITWNLATSNVVAGMIAMVPSPAPYIVQAAHANQSYTASSVVSVTMPQAPAQNNGLIAIATCENTTVGTLTPGSGWTQLAFSGTQSFPGAVFLYKVCGAGESTTQSPFTNLSVTRTISTTVWEVAGFGSGVFSSDYIKLTNTSLNDVGSYARTSASTTQALSSGAIGNNGSNSNLILYQASLATTAGATVSTKPLNYAVSFNDTAAYPVWAGFLPNVLSGNSPAASITFSLATAAISACAAMLIAGKTTSVPVSDAASPTVIQKQATGSGTTASGTTHSFVGGALSTPPTVGNEMYAVMCGNQQLGGGNFTSPIASGWTLVAQNVSGGALGPLWAVFRRVVQSGDTGTVTITTTSASTTTLGYTIVLLEINGVKDGAAVGVGESNPGGQTANGSVAFNQTAPGNLALFWFADYVNGSPTIADSGWGSSTTLTGGTSVSNGSGTNPLFALVCTDTDISGAVTSGIGLSWTATTYGTPGANIACVILPGGTRVKDSVSFQAQLSRLPTDTDPSYSDSVSGTVTYDRPVSDTVVSYSDSVSRAVAYLRSLSTTDPTYSESLATLKLKNRPVADTDPTYSDSISRAVHSSRSVSNTNIVSDAISRLVQYHRAISTTDPTFSDSVDFAYVILRRMIVDDEFAAAMLFDLSLTEPAIVDDAHTENLIFDK